MKHMREQISKDARRDHSLDELTDEREKNNRTLYKETECNRT